jgi:hypothetical protein
VRHRPAAWCARLLLSAQSLDYHMCERSLRWFPQDFFRRKSPEKLVKLVGEQFEVLKGSASDAAKEKVGARKSLCRSDASARFLLL